MWFFKDILGPWAMANYCRAVTKSPRRTLSSPFFPLLPSFILFFYLLHYTLFAISLNPPWFSPHVPSFSIFSILHSSLYSHPHSSISSSLHIYISSFFIFSSLPSLHSSLSSHPSFFLLLPSFILLSPPMLHSSLSSHPSFFPLLPSFILPSPPILLSSRLLSTIY